MFGGRKSLHSETYQPNKKLTNIFSSTTTPIRGGARGARSHRTADHRGGFGHVCDALFLCVNQNVYMNEEEHND